MVTIGCGAQLDSVLKVKRLPAIRHATDITFHMGGGERWVEIRTREGNLISFQPASARREVDQRHFLALDPEAPGERSAFGAVSEAEVSAEKGWIDLRTALVRDGVLRIVIADAAELKAVGGFVTGGL